MRESIGKQIKWSNPDYHTPSNYVNGIKMPRDVAHSSISLNPDSVVDTWTCLEMHKKV